MSLRGRGTFGVRRCGRVGWMFRLGAVAAVFGCVRSIEAHAGEAHGGEDWWRVWNWAPLILINLGLVTWLYANGLARLWRQAGVGRGVSLRQAGAFGCGVIALFAALISPIDFLSGELSWVHMVQHMMLMNLAAPLLVLGSPGLVLMWGLPGNWRLRVGKWKREFEEWDPPWYLLWQPLLMWGLYAGVLWIWHLPVLYQAALRNQLLHDFQHLSFLAAACLFWRVLLDPLSRLRLSRGVGVIYLFATSLHATVLGVFMALAPTVWYPDYEVTTAAWNLTALEDQQLAGLIMWMPACMIYAVAAAAVFGIWLQEGPESGVEA